MSTLEHKAEAITDFLRNRASLQRLTSYDEVGRVAASLLALRGQRSTSRPLDRDAVAEVLKTVDSNSLENNGILLSSLIVHFWDNRPGHRFYEQAVERGLLEQDASQDNRFAFHAAALARVFEAYPHVITVDLDPVNLDEVYVEDDASDLDDEYEDADSEY